MQGNKSEQPFPRQCQVLARRGDMRSNAADSEGNQNKGGSCVCVVARSTPGEETAHTYPGRQDLVRLEELEEMGIVIRDGRQTESREGV